MKIKKLCLSFTAKMTLFAAFMVVLIILIIGSSTLYTFTKAFNSEIKVFNMNVLNQVKVNFETQIFADVERAVDFISMDSEFGMLSADFLTKTVSENQLTYLHIMDYLKKKVVINIKYADSINLYSNKSNVILNTKWGIAYLDHDNPRGWIRDENFISLYKSTGRHEVWLPTRQLESNAKRYGKENIITYAKSLPLSSSKNLGLFSINISEKTIRDKISEILKNGYENILLVSKDGIILSHQDENMICKDVSNEMWFQSLANNASQIRTISGKDYVISSLDSSYIDMYYVYLTEASQYYKATNLLKQNVLIICLITMLCSIFVSIIIQTHLSKPFLHLTKTARDILNDESTITTPERNEVQIIENTLDLLTSKSKKLENTLERNQKAIRNTLLINILLGNITITDEFNRQLEYAGVSFPYAYYAVILIKLDNDTSPPHEKGESIIEYIETTYSQTYCVQIDEPVFALILNFNELDMSLCSLISIGVSAYLLKTYSLSSNFSVSEIVSDLKLLNKCYLETVSVLKYKCLNPYNTIFYYSKYSSRNIDDEVIRSYVQNLLYALEKSSGSKLNIALSELENLLASGASLANYDYAKRFAYDGIIDILKEVSANDSFVTNTVDSAYLLDTFFLHDFILRLNDICNKILEYQKTRFADNNAIYVSKAKEYVKANFQDSISLKTTADSLYISAEHLSRVFKKIAGENFVDYLTRVRMENAKILLSSTQLSIPDISMKIGILNTDYFNRKYKAFYGITPSQYRKTIEVEQ